MFVFIFIVIRPDFAPSSPPESDLTQFQNFEPDLGGANKPELLKENSRHSSHRKIDHAILKNIMLKF